MTFRVFEELLLVTLVVLALTVMRLARRGDGHAGHGYTWAIGGTLALGVAALVQGTRGLAIAVMVLTAALVVLPAVLELGARRCFARGWLRLAVALAGARAHLMLGAGLGRQQSILEGLAVLERGGVDEALAHFRRLADASEDTGELTLIHEQIVAMLFYAARWGDAITHYEAKFHPRYAALRPALALGLLRAYGETGRLQAAAALLAALEEGPIGADQRAASLVSQARVTFLAYAGASTPVSAALTGDGHHLLGLSPASSALLQGIAHARAGDRDAAVAELSRVAELARRRDSRVVEAGRNALARLDDSAAPVPSLEPELLGYVEAVAARLQAFVERGPRWKRSGQLVATPLLMLALGAGFLRTWGEASGMRLLEAGALAPQLWRDGFYERALTGLFVQADVFALMLDLYGVYLAGALVERLTSGGRLLWLAVAGGAVALATCATMVAPGPLVFMGSHFMVTTVVAAALVCMHPRRTPLLSRRLRRGATLSLLFVLGAQLLVGLRGATLMGAPLPGFIVAGAVGAAAALPLPRAAIERVLGVTAVVLGLVVVVAHAWSTKRFDDEAFALQHRTQVVADGVRWSLPPGFRLAPSAGARLPIALEAGFIDGYALGNDALVQVFATRADAAPAVFTAAPELERELRLAPAEVPPAFARAYTRVGANVGLLSAHRLWRNGVVVGIAIERPLGQRRAVLLAAPASAIEPFAAVYAAVLADAVVVAGAPQ